ncbi:MAG: iron-sulfur cluster assembly scaffold protein [Calditrichia bacterium]
MDEKRIALLKAMGYPDKAINYILNRTNVGEMEDASVTAKEQGTCGDIMIIHLKIEDDIIRQARYDYIGCAGLQAAASAITEMIKDRPLGEAGRISAEDVLNFLGGLPQQKHECALLASNTLKRALSEYAPASA